MVFLVPQVGFRDLQINFTEDPWTLKLALGILKLVLGTLKLVLGTLKLALGTLMGT